MRPRLSISVRLTLGYALTLALLLGAFAVFSYVRFHEGLHRDFEHHLAHETRALRPFVALSADGPVLRAPERIEAVAIRTGGTHGTYVRLLDAAGRVRYESPNFAEMPPLDTSLPPTDGVGARSRVWNGMPARLLFTPLADASGTTAGWLVVAGFEWSLHQELDRLASTLALGTLVGMLLSIAIGLWLGRRALHPVARMTDAANHIGSTDLQARLPVAEGVHDELTDLAEAFNGLIGRLDEAVKHEKRFAANAAHELLTPLASLRTAAEVALRRDRSPEDYRRVLAGAVEEATRLSGVVDGLLSLARAEQRPLQADATDLAAVATAAVAAVAERARARGIALGVSVERGVRGAMGDVAARTAVANLLDNALKYTPAGGQVDVRVDRDGGVARVQVADTGIGLSASDAPRVFDRFFRASTADVSAQAGSGLGLSVVHTLAIAHGGAVRVESAGRGQGSTFTLSVPVAEGPPVAPDSQEI